MPEEARLAARLYRSQTSGGGCEPGAVPRQRDASEYCPVCSRQLAAKSCKLVCACGYYMSCSDYY